MAAVARRLRAADAVPRRRAATRSRRRTCAARAATASGSSSSTTSRLRLDSVRDLAALHAWLAARPEIDGSRAVVYGRSYGGYMVLAALAFQPEIWAAGIESVGISSLGHVPREHVAVPPRGARAGVRLARARPRVPRGALADHARRRDPRAALHPARRERPARAGVRVGGDRRCSREGHPLRARRLSRRGPHDREAREPHRLRSSARSRSSTKSSREPPIRWRSAAPWPSG